MYFLICIVPKYINITGRKPCIFGQHDIISNGLYLTKDYNYVLNHTQPVVTLIKNKRFIFKSRERNPSFCHLETCFSRRIVSS